MKTHDRVHFNCDICGKDVDLFFIDKEKNFKKYNKNLCRGCRQHLQYESGLRDRNLIKNSVKPQKGISMKDRCNMTDEEYQLYKKNLSEKSSGENNPMYNEHTHTKGLIAHNFSRRGKTWDETYGKEVANEKRNKMSLHNSGKGNPMFGKPAPTGSGNGWSGWYKHFYFRSLLELSFLVKHQNVENAEYIKIPYTDFDGKERTYHPDFIEGNMLYEIKPQHLVNAATNKLKFEAAKKYCEENKLIFVIETENSTQKLSDEEIKILHDNNEIKFIDRYEEKYRRRLR